MIVIIEHYYCISRGSQAAELRLHADSLLLMPALKQLQALACSTVPIETASQEPTVEIQGLVTQDH